MVYDTLSLYEFLTAEPSQFLYTALVRYSPYTFKDDFSQTHTLPSLKPIGK